MILEGKLASGPTPSESLRYDSLQFGADRVGKRRKAQSRGLRGPDPIEWTIGRRREAPVLAEARTLLLGPTFFAEFHAHESRDEPGCDR
jgi:hypothetical protein